ncbi:MAG: GntR family transcriptional regulator [Anaerolineaceae bacterium]|nr:GntR family transcriptional regulator [Anaerolineaceae bacterium]
MTVHNSKPLSFDGSPHFLINRQSKTPLYQQIYEILHGQITQGIWQVGNMIPAEPELIEHFNVSRTTVRQVLEMLENDGLIIRQQGRGTFIAEPRLERRLERIISFTEDMHQRGLTPQTQVINAGINIASDELAEKLKIQPGEEIVRIERLRLANNEPMSMEMSDIAHKYCPGILKYDFSLVPLRKTLETEFNIFLSGAKQTIQAVAANTQIANLLTIPKQAPLLKIERISYFQQETPVERLRIYYRGDRYSLYNELKG